MTAKEELKQKFEEAFDDTEQKENAARALTTQGDAAIAVWGDRDTVIATGIRIKTMLPGGDKLTIPHALAAGQYAVATGLNPFRGEFYAYTDKKGNLNIVDGYKALTRWAEDECPFDVQYREEELGPGEAYNEKAVIMRHDRKPQLDYYLDKGADFQTAFELVTTSAVGVVMENETKWGDGNPKDPPKGWTWRQVAQKRALKTALNMSHGMPTVAELARKSWEVAGIMTQPEDWDGTDELKTQEEKERLAAMQAQHREWKAEWDTASPEERQRRGKEAGRILHGDPDFEGFGDEPDNQFAEEDVVNGEVVVHEQPKAPMTLREALDIGLPAAAPKMGLEAGTALLDVVRLNEKNLIEYLAKPSSYKEMSEDNLRVQAAATIIFKQWDIARGMCIGDEEKEAVEPEEMHVEEGVETPLF